MQYVDDNMEELMRKAAEQYPLNTEGADWDAVMQKMDDTTNTPQNEEPKKRRRFLWLLLFLPAALLLFTIADYKTMHKKFDSIATTKKSLDKSQPVNKESRSNNNNTRNFAANQNNKQEITTKNSISSNSFNYNKRADKNDLSNSKTILENNGSNKMKVVADNNNNIINAANNGSIEGDAAAKNKHIEAPVINDNKQSTLDQQSVADGSAKQNNITDTATAKEVLIQKSATNKVKKKNISSSQRNGFYAGLAAGFDVSTIKLQKIRGTGYSLSVLVGYKISKHVSLETALMLDEKKYYSDGKYFDTKRTGLPADDKVLNLHGTCNMFEVPVNVKYDFNAKKGGNFFAIGGLSTYIMKKESYHYYANYLGDYYYGFRNYKNSGSNVFSVLNVGAGYQFNIQKAGKLRIEPYLKVPLSGIGIGNLPITSAGISVGFTKQF